MTYKVEIRVEGYLVINTKTDAVQSCWASKSTAYRTCKDLNYAVNKGLVK